MDRSFFRYWLPLSLLLHLLVLALLHGVSSSIRTADGDMMQEVTVLQVSTPAAPLIATPPPRQRQKAERPGSDQPLTNNGTEALDSVVTSHAQTHAASAPEKVPTTEESNWVTAPGLDNGKGANGHDLTSNGSSYGAAAQGGPTPSYPKLAEERGAEGTVVVRVTISAVGVASAPSVVQSSGDADLDAAALLAAAHWNFSPAMKNGQSVTSTLKLSFHFAKGAVTVAAEGH